MLGCGLGIAATFPAAQVFTHTLGSYFPTFRVEPKTVYLDLAAGCVVGGCAGIIPAIRAIQIRIADGLRRIG
jgi:putative ABC transport system permease protein